MNPVPVVRSRSAWSLDLYGSASRCLLRLWENQGNVTLSDGDFLRRYEARYPRWETHPGELDRDALRGLAQEFGFEADMAETADYMQVLQAHRYGHAVIIATKRAPVQREQPPADGLRLHFMILEQMDEDGFVVWCPFESGASAVLPRAERVWWSHWAASAFVLRHNYPLQS